MVQNMEKNKKRREIKNERSESVEKVRENALICSNYYTQLGDYTWTCIKSTTTIDSSLTQQKTKSTPGLFI